MIYKNAEKFKLYQQILICIFPFILLFMFYLIAQSNIIDNIHLWDCIIYKYLHIQCPGCGMTRAIKALFHFDILSSLQYNAMLLILIGILIILYIEFIFRAFGKIVFSIVRNKYFIIVLFVFFISYSVLRNFCVLL